MSTVEVVLVLIGISWITGFYMGHEFHPLRKFRYGLAHKILGKK